MIIEGFKVVRLNWFFFVFFITFDIGYKEKLDSYKVYFRCFLEVEWEKMKRLLRIKKYKENKNEKDKF